MQIRKHKTGNKCALRKPCSITKDNATIRTSCHVPKPNCESGYLLLDIECKSVRLLSLKPCNPCLLVLALLLVDVVSALTPSLRKWCMRGLPADQHYKQYQIERPDMT